MASGIARGRVRTTTTTATTTVESRKDGGHPPYNRLTGTWRLGLQCTSLTLDIHVMRAFLTINGNTFDRSYQTAEQNNKWPRRGWSAKCYFKAKSSVRIRVAGLKGMYLLMIDRGWAHRKTQRFSISEHWTVIVFYIITKSMRALWLVNQLWFIVTINPRENGASSELLYKSNRQQASMVYKLINHLGCW